mgnify:CR=1 FL=1
MFSSMGSVIFFDSVKPISYVAVDSLDGLEQEKKQMQLAIVSAIMMLLIFIIIFLSVSYKNQCKYRCFT